MCVCVCVCVCVCSCLCLCVRVHVRVNLYLPSFYCATSSNKARMESDKQSKKCHHIISQTKICFKKEDILRLLVLSDLFVALCVFQDQ